MLDVFIFFVSVVVVLISESKFSVVKSCFFEGPVHDLIAISLLNFFVISAGQLSTRAAVKELGFRTEAGAVGFQTQLSEN